MKVVSLVKNGEISAFCILGSLVKNGGISTICISSP